MIRIDRHEEVDGTANSGTRHGVWAYSCAEYPLVQGHSRQPLFAACRQLTALYGVTGLRVGVFREGHEVADISCPVELGAATTVMESYREAPRFGKYTDLSRIWGSSPLAAPSSQIEGV